MRVFLVGYMGSGKTRMGQKLSELTGYPFVDTDEVFESKYRISIFDFFARYGETSFRKIEKEILKETLNNPDAIIATGGGTPCFFDNMDLIKTGGISIYLRMDITTLVSRLALVRKKRPLLKDKPAGELDSYVRAQLSEREPFYDRADYTVDALKIGAGEIWRMVNGRSA